MPYIYRYINPDGETKYIGIIKQDTNMPGRFYQHRGDDWYNDCNWKIQYAYYETIADVEVLEGHLIAVELERDHELFNKAKTNWGESSFVDEKTINWKDYDERDFPTKSRRCCSLLDKQYSTLQDEVFSVRRQIKSIEGQLRDIRDDLDNNMKHDFIEWFYEDIKVLSRSSIQKAYEKTGIKANTSISALYHSYIIYINEHDCYGYYDEDAFVYRIGQRNSVFNNSGIYIGEFSGKKFVFGCLLKNDPLLETALGIYEEEKRSAVLSIDIGI